MKNLYTFFLSLVLSASAASAQSYCSPTFSNGCFSWTNLSISLGSLNWTNSDCNISDYTGLGTPVTAGTPTAMTVVSGAWTGCAVWVDLNNDFTFQDTENLYYAYVGGSPSYTYSFNITVPANTPTGTYRMRVIAPWGSDGFLDTNTNGYGPCGIFQYGNFDDFTLNVSGTTGVGELTSASLLASPNPTTGTVWLGSDGKSPVQHIVVRAVDGRMVQDLSISASHGRVQLDLSALPDGMYMLECMSSATSHTVRVIKQ